MRGHDIVSGQRINPVTAERAWQFRHQMTEAERVLWQAVRADRLHGLHFRRQQIVDGFIVDFYCHAVRLVVEVDGPIHDQKGEADSERESLLTGRGVRVLRVTNAEVMQDLGIVLARILGAARSSFPRGEGG